MRNKNQCMVLRNQAGLYVTSYSYIILYIFQIIVCKHDDKSTSEKSRFKREIEFVKATASGKEVQQDLKRLKIRRYQNDLLKALHE